MRSAALLPGLTVRLGKPEDGDFIAELGRKVFSAYGSYDRYLHEWFSSPGVVTLVAEVEGVPAGAAMLAKLGADDSRGLAELLAIAVEPALQSRGVGSFLLRQAIGLAPRLASDPPVREIHLSVAEGNARAERLFARHGFRRLAGSGVYPAGQRARLMVKQLSPGGLSCKSTEERS